MDQTKRLYALVEALRAHAPRLLRAADLARCFEVSTRTIERDLFALQLAGVPIYAQPGPGGGYGLHVEATLPPLHSPPAEAAALATALAATGPYGWRATYASPRRLAAAPARWRRSCSRA